MYGASSRRNFLRTLLAGAGPGQYALRALTGMAISSAFHASAAAQAHDQHDELSVTPLAPKLRLVSGFGGNVVVLRTDDGLLMVNGGAPAQSSRLLAAMKDGTGGAPVKMLFNTDWHPDHTGSNETLAAAGAQIVAHEHTKQYLSTEFFVDWESRTYRPLPAKALPTRTFYTKESMTFGGERVEFAHLGQAHTDGDIYVFFPDSNVLVAGDVLSAGTYPIADYTTGGWLGGLGTATKTLLDLSNEQTRIVPGHGPVQTRADVQAQLEMLTAVRDKLTKMMRQGLGSKDMLAAGVTKEFDAKWGDPSLFVSTSYRGLWLHVRELGGIV